MLNLKDILTITGKPGLYCIVTQTAKGVIVETVDEKRTKMPVQNNYQVAMLDEITIFTNEEEDLALRQIFENIEKRDGLAPSVDAKSDAVAIKSYFKEVAPSHDVERVYVSDMKKILKWYEILSKFSRADEVPAVEESVKENNEA